MKRPNEFFQWLDENRDVGLLMVRLYVGLRLASGALRRLIENERLEKFGSLVEDAGIPLASTIALIAFVIQLVAGLLLIAGWHTRWAALSIVLVLTFSLFLSKQYDFLHAGMPPLAAMVICMIFIFVPPGRFSLAQKQKKL